MEWLRVMFLFLLSNLSAAGIYPTAWLQRSDAQGVWTGVSCHNPAHFWCAWVFISFGYLYNKNESTSTHARKTSFIFSSGFPDGTFPSPTLQIYRFNQNTTSTKKDGLLD